MREIRFRAWDKDRNKMIYQFENSLTTSNYVLSWDSDNHRMYCGNYMDNGDWQQPELMQYTGLKDKNGKEIYEGHWIFYDGDFYQINFKAGSFGIDVPKGKGVNTERILHSTQWVAHETPELL